MSTVFDLEKAFDHVWHNALVYKLNRFQIPLAYIKQMYQFLYNRMAYVDIKKINPLFQFPHLLEYHKETTSATSYFLR